MFSHSVHPFLDDTIFIIHHLKKTYSRNLIYSIVMYHRQVPISDTPTVSINDDS